MPWRWPGRRLVIAVVAGLFLTGRSWADDAVPAPVPALKIVYLARDADPAYAEVASDDGVFRPPLPEPFAGAELAVKDTRAIAHALGVTIGLEKDVLDPDADIAAEARKIVEGGAVAVVADLPEDDLVGLAQALPAKALPIFNIRHSADPLRRQLCAGSVFHVVPSTSMLTDALAQFIVRKTWKRVLILAGPLPADTVLADAFAASAKKFGARVTNRLSFVFGNDPRHRDETNVAIMTAPEDYDVLFLADTLQDFGRFVPYQQSKPRPVVGTEGLEASAWDPLAERYGAPQVNHRFERSAHRPMTDGDWAAWVAVRAVVEAVSRTPARTGPAIVAALANADLAMDVSKGVQSSFRPWDHQFRQSIMLHSGDAVVDYAPIEGFLHRRTPLDTLGADEGEVPCPGKPP